jgi:hypothetical protein
VLLCGENRESNATLEDGNLKLRQLRNSFLAVFKRDVLQKDLIQEDKNTIFEGDVNADAREDAKLYESPGIPRTDRAVFKALYGLDPSMLALIGKFKFTIINPDS